MSDSNWYGMLNLRVGVTIYPSQDRAIEQVMSDLMQHCPAQFALLADSSGLIISVQGEREGSDPVALASLVAGDFSASQEIARLTGQYQSYQMIVREGAQASSFIAEAGRYMILFVQVSSDVPLGWARLQIRDAGHKLAEIVSAPHEDLEQLERPNLGLGEEQLSDLADDALDSMWND